MHDCQCCPMADEAPDLLGKLAGMLADLNGYIDRRAQELAEPVVRKAFAAAAEDVAAAKGETQRLRGVADELGRWIRLLERPASEADAARRKLAAALGHHPAGRLLPGLVDEVLARLKENPDGI
jgi:hypothetical protein